MHPMSTKSSKAVSADPIAQRRLNSTPRHKPGWIDSRVCRSIPATDLQRTAVLFSRHDGLRHLAPLRRRSRQEGLSGNAGSSVARLQELIESRRIELFPAGVLADQIRRGGSSGHFVLEVLKSLPVPPLAVALQLVVAASVYNAALMPIALAVVRKLHSPMTRRPEPV